MRPSTSGHSVVAARADVDRAVPSRVSARASAACVQRCMKGLVCSVECGPAMTTHANTAHFPPGATAVSPAAAPALIDIGINLTHDSYDSDRDAVLARAAA